MTNFLCPQFTTNPEASSLFWRYFLIILGPDLQNILRQSYDYLTIMPKLRSTYDGRLITKHHTMNEKLFIGKIHVQNRNIVGDSVRKLAYDIPERNFSMF